MKLLTLTSALTLVTLLGYFGLLFTGTDVPEFVEWMLGILIGGTTGIAAEKMKPK